METRTHEFEGLHNFRDFGGYVAGNRRLVTGRLFRSANHAMATEADLARLREMGIGAVVDLAFAADQRDRDVARQVFHDFELLIVRAILGFAG